MSGRDYIHVAKNMGGIMSTYTKMGLCPGGILSYTQKTDQSESLE